jgi:hypothetical protein
MIFLFSLCRIFGSLFDIQHYIDCYDYIQHYIDCYDWYSANQVMKSNIEEDNV